METVHPMVHWSLGGKRYLCLEHRAVFTSQMFQTHGTHTTDVLRNMEFAGSKYYILLYTYVKKILIQFQL